MNSITLHRFGLCVVGVLVFASLLLTACRQPDPVRVLQGSTMGTTWTVRLAGMPPGLDEAVLREGIEAELATVNRQMSTYAEDSQISRFNRLPAGASQVLTADLQMVLRAALELAEDSEGAYDPTIGPLVNLWGFGPEPYRDEAPAEALITEMLGRVGWQRLEWDRRATRLIQPGGVYLDLSSIAKGYAVDRVLVYLMTQGVHGVLVDIGGDTRMQGHKPDGRAWRIAIEQPLPGPRAVQRVIEPGDRAVATSGSYRNFFEVGGRQFSHTIDPRTGYPIQHDLLSVTVVHDSCLQADALATALLVLGPEPGYAFAVRRGLAAMFLQQEDGRIVERMTPAFRSLVE